MTQIKLSGANLEYLRTGRGDNLVLIPGFASGIWIWKYQIQRLSEHFNVFTFDPRGIAGSTITDQKPSSIEAIADDLAELMSVLNISKANLLGASFGGFVAMTFAVKYPELVSKLVLVCTSFGGKNHVPPRGAVLETFGSSSNDESIRQNLYSAFSPAFVAKNVEAVNEFCDERLKNHVSDRVYDEQLASALEFDIESRLDRISADSLVISGNNDNVVPAENSLHLTDRLPNGRLEIIKDTGHMLFVEKADKFNRLVIDFLEE